MHVVDDGIIVGNVERNRGQCENCGHTTMVINIQLVSLPDGINYDRRLIVADSNDQRISHIGIGCGCYAKFHRQIAHIVDATKR